jgi:hypothetical protein
LDENVINIKRNTVSSVKGGWSINKHRKDCLWLCLVTKMQDKATSYWLLMNP